MRNIQIEEAPWTDVLVLGGGLCGMYAAIEADRAGKEVLLLSKGRVGLSGSSVVSMSVHRFAPEEPELREEYRARFLRSGGGVQDASVACMLVEEGAAAVAALREFGVPLEYHTMKSPRGDFAAMACCRPKLGRYLTAPLRGYLEGRTGVILREGEMAFELVTLDGRMAGVLAERAGGVTFYPAGAVVLATGGGGNIYSRTSNPTDLTGDGYAMARRLGLPLVGMEFIQFYPLPRRYPQSGQPLPRHL